MPEQTFDGATPTGRPRAFQTIVYGGLAVGVLDGLAAVTNAGLRGVGPVRVFQYIASGLFGPAAIGGGWTTVLLGVLIHFLIAFAVAAVYYRASLRLPLLIRRALLCGAIYGVAVYFLMGRVVVPLSAARGLPFSLAQLVIHILFVGLPVALIARRSARANRSRGA
jgi:hypothetical protein